MKCLLSWNSSIERAAPTTKPLLPSLEHLFFYTTTVLEQLPLGSEMVAHSLQDLVQSLQQSVHHLVALKVVWVLHQHLHKAAEI